MTKPFEIEVQNTRDSGMVTVIQNQHGLVVAVSGHSVDVYTPEQTKALIDALTKAIEHIDREKAEALPPEQAHDKAMVERRKVAERIETREATYARVNKTKAKRLDPDEVLTALGHLNLVIGNHLHREREAS